MCVPPRDTFWGDGGDVVWGKGSSLEEFNPSNASCVPRPCSPQRGGRLKKMSTTNYVAGD